MTTEEIKALPRPIQVFSTFDRAETFGRFHRLRGMHDLRVIRENHDLAGAKGAILMLPGWKRLSVETWHELKALAELGRITVHELSEREAYGIIR